jgi:hypothetical protein
MHCVSEKNHTTQPLHMHNLNRAWYEIVQHYPRHPWVHNWMAGRFHEPAGIHLLGHDLMRTFCNLIIDVLMRSRARRVVLAGFLDVVRQLREAIFKAHVARTLLGPVPCIVKAL